MHPTLLIGPYDWDSQRLPESEFRERIKTFWKKMPDSTISSAIVYGDSRNHAELMYLSNFLPKLGPALLLVPRNSEPTLLVSGAPTMLSAARRMTWIEKTQPLGVPAESVRKWMNDCGNPSGAQSQQQTLLINGDSMRGALYRSLSEVLEPKGSLIDDTSKLRALMRRKRPIELTLIREACAILMTANKALAEAKASGASVTAAILEAENAARHAGAQDVRTLFSFDGGRTLRPFEQLIDRATDPLQVYFALRYAGYWAEGFVHLADSADEITAKASSALDKVISRSQTGTTSRELVRIMEEAIHPYKSHPMTTASIGNSIGLSLTEEPRLLANRDDTIDAGCVYTLQIGATDGVNHHAIVSAMIYVEQNDTEVLWSAPR
jgi:Xaa-Pro aminopeptidase